MKNLNYFLIIGSNLGDRINQLELAKKMIASEVGGITKESAIYETQPWGFDDQPWFLNQVIEVKSPDSPEDVLIKLKAIEIKAGRTPAEKWHARHIDIDILLCGDQILNKKELIIPHPHLQERNFVLIPLMELAPELVHPVLGLSIEDLYFDSRDTGEVYIFNPDEQGNPL